jgi:hypothetical protein
MRKRYPLNTTTRTDDRGDARKPSYRLHNGFRMPMGFPVEGLDSGMRYQAVSGDVFVCTYPKCGTTWTQYMVYLLLRRRAITESESLGEYFPHLEEVGAPVVAKLPQPRMIKTHLSLDMTPYSPAAKYILVIRNPFDCAVSFYHHTRGFPKHYDFQDGRFDVFVECFIAGDVDFGDYFDHLVPWVGAADRDNVLLLTYESLKADTVKELSKLAEFLGGDAAKTAEDAAVLDWVVRESSIASMQKGQSRWASERPEGSPFVRKGVVGDWRDRFDPDQARALAAKFRERTLGTPAAGLWPEILAEARDFTSISTP